jgi:uncharacterized protein (DUF2062 family)
MRNLFFRAASSTYRAWFLYERFIVEKLRRDCRVRNVKEGTFIERGRLMSRLKAAAKRNAILWLSQGISPRRLALTLALGFAIGCIPVVGIPTVLCVTVALALRLNLPAIQAANYAAMPLQLALIVPFMRLGRWLVSAESARMLVSGPAVHFPPFGIAARMGSLAGQAMLAWLLVAIPAVALMTTTLTLMLRRIPAVNAAEAGD